MIEVKNVFKSYDNVEVLKGIDLTIQKGSSVAITGKSGAGKSTLLHILGTLDEPDKGQILFENEDIFKLKSKKLANLRNNKIGFVFQFHHLLNEFNAVENVAIPHLIGGAKKEIAMAKAKEILRFLEMDHRFDHKPNELSGGEQQRVAFARALINDPTVVFADEPTGNLDKGTSEEVHHIINKLKEQQELTFVIVTHDASLADICETRFEMEDGKIKN